MKVLAIVFAIAICCCSAQTATGGYTAVSATDIQNSPTIQSLANYGGQAAVQQALSEGKLPNSDANFKLTKINSVDQQVVNGINYRFNVTLTNSNNGVVIVALFTIYYQASSNTRQITSSSFQILTYSLPSSTTATPAKAQTQPQTQVGGYSLVAANDVQNSALLQSLANLGAQNIVQQAVSQKKLPTSNSNFTVAKINSVYQQVVNGINYKFNVTLTNSDGITIYAQFVIYYQASSNTRQVASSSFSIAPYNVAPAQSTSSPAPSTQAGGWTLISPSDVQNSATIQSLADFGAQDVAQQAIAAGKVPSNSKFRVTKINSVYSQVVNGINYKFNVNLSNADGSINIVAAYIVYYQSWTNTRKVLSSSYQIAPK